MGRRQPFLRVCSAMGMVGMRGTSRDASIVVMRTTVLLYSSPIISQLQVSGNMGQYLIASCSISIDCYIPKNRHEITESDQLRRLIKVITYER